MLGNTRPEYKVWSPCALGEVQRPLSCGWYRTLDAFAFVVKAFIANLRGCLGGVISEGKSHVFNEFYLALLNLYLVNLCYLRQARDSLQCQAAFHARLCLDNILSENNLIQKGCWVIECYYTLDYSNTLPSTHSKMITKVKLVIIFKIKVPRTSFKQGNKT